MHRIPVAGSSDTRDLPLVDGFDEELKILERRRWQHAMPEIEDVTRPSAGAAEHVTRAVADQLGRTEEHCRIEVALDTSIVTDSFPAVVQRNSPVERNDTRAGGRDGFEQAGRICPEMYARHVQ